MTSRKIITLEFATETATGQPHFLETTENGVLFVSPILDRPAARKQFEDFVLVHGDPIVDDNEDNGDDEDNEPSTREVALGAIIQEGLTLQELLGATSLMGGHLERAKLFQAPLAETLGTMAFVLSLDPEVLRLLAGYSTLELISRLSPETP